MLQTARHSIFTDIFDMVNLKNSRNEHEQHLFLITLLAFPILNLYLAINIEAFAESTLMKKILSTIRRKKQPKNPYNQLIASQPNMLL
ncbi:putative cation-transporting ATPase 13A3 isoform X2 [Aphis craccivora]|uniref:Putative cation-transporting ATPase 13A3 isoform X2 n=1 Tax=Aphis craccivora TaxID=307492 RepID=A0A6G0W8S2_APHCR|nr:putative cation-transporting ATPase 13A3 isoform X2 [Aphis craccivora]